MKEMIVQAWDDLDLHQDQFKTPADVSVTLTATVTDEDGKVIHDVNVSLDLTRDHGAVFWDSMKPWAEAGQQQKKASKKKAAAELAPPVSGSQRPASVAPLEKLCPFRPNTRERREWLEELRNWADRQGRTVEYHPPDWDGAPSTNYHYVKQLLLDYIASPEYPDWLPKAS